MMGLGQRLAWVFSACLLAVSACGGDDNKSSGSAAGAGGSAGASGRAAAGSGSSGSGASKGNGTGEEGVECSSDSECGSGLKCLPGAVLQSSSRSVLIKVCARSCTQDSDCMENETCSSEVTRQPKDALCWSTTSEVFKPCGPADTSMCSGDLECLPVVEDGKIGGYCVQPCELPSSGKMGTPCPEGLSCLDELGIPGVGLCAKRVGRNETCGPEIGAICGTDDVCLTDPKDKSSLCYQDCTTTKMCDGGKTCVVQDTDLAYCE